MKQYVIDELRPADYEKLKTYLEQHVSPGSLPGIYWIALEQKLLNDLQAAHTECRPFYFAMELRSDALASEFLIRTQNRLRCDCIGYAMEEQRQWIIRFADSIFERLEIKT
ncbi:MAG: hypothetical protein Q8P24_02025 [Desulfobacterales bacterium]|nr:hypothetical protein [Desulfobacterales bacterium]